MFDTFFSDVADHISEQVSINCYPTMYGVGVRIPSGETIESFSDEVDLIRSYLDIHGVSYTESYSEKERAYRFNFI